MDDSYYCTRWFWKPSDFHRRCQTEDGMIIGMTEDEGLPHCIRVEHGDECAEYVWEDPMYRFPPNRRASDATLRAQVLKVQEEARELAEACDAATDSYGRDHAVEEAWDVIQAAEGVIRKLAGMGASAEAGLAYVYLKDKARGDYR